VEGRIPSNCLNRALFGSPAPAPMGGLASSAIVAGLGGGLDLRLAGTWPESHLVIAHDACSHQGGGASSVAGAHCQSTGSYSASACGSTGMPFCRSQFTTSRRSASARLLRIERG